MFDDVFASLFACSACQARERLWSRSGSSSIWTRPMKSADVNSSTSSQVTVRKGGCESSGPRV